MTPLAEAIVREVLRELEVSGLLAHLPVEAQAEQMAELWQTLLVRVTRAYVESVLGLLTLDGFGAIEFAAQAGFFPHLYVAAKLGLAFRTPNNSARPGAVAKARTVKTNDAEVIACRRHQSADVKILQQCSIAMQHH